jgi:hypothetical protein
MFGKDKNEIYCSWAPLFTALQTQGEKKQLRAAFFCKLCYSTVTIGVQLSSSSN